MTFALEGVTYRYPGRDRDALVDVNLVLPADTTVAVLGPSASGKTTLLYLLGLLWERGLAGGRIAYGNGAGTVDYAELPSWAKAGLRQREFGFVLQSSYLLGNFTCLENVAMPLALQGWGVKEREKHAANLISRADRKDPETNSANPTGSAEHGERLEQAMNRLPRDVSGGQRQRMAVLRAVAHNPRVVFADEPFSQLDPGNARKVLDLLEEWRKGGLNPGATGPPRTLVLVCHLPEIARERAEWFVLLRDGRPVGKCPFHRDEWTSRKDDIRRTLDPDGPNERP